MTQHLLQEDAGDGLEIDQIHVPRQGTCKGEVEIDLPFRAKGLVARDRDVEIAVRSETILRCGPIDQDDTDLRVVRDDPIDVRFEEFLVDHCGYGAVPPAEPSDQRVALFSVRGAWDGGMGLRPGTVRLSRLVPVRSGTSRTPRKPERAMEYKVDSTTLTLVQGDITQQAVDAIVNAAN